MRTFTHFFFSFLNKIDKILETSVHSRFKISRVLFKLFHKRSRKEKFVYKPGDFTADVSWKVPRRLERGFSFHVNSIYLLLLVLSISISFI